jgi:hypothetical protein
MIALLVAMLAAPAVCAQEKSARDGVVELDSSLVLTPGKADDPLTFRFQSNTAKPLSAYLSTSAESFFGFRYHKLSRMECAWQGAGTGMTLGMIAGAAGMASGMFDEDTAWYMVGAAAALGAVFGAMKADDPKFNVQLRWEPLDYDRR